MNGHHEKLLLQHVLNETEIIIKLQREIVKANKWQYFVDLPEKKLITVNCGSFKQRSRYFVDC